MQFLVETLAWREDGCAADVLGFVRTVLVGVVRGVGGVGEGLLLGSGHEGDIDQLELNSATFINDDG
jgi:hypothetical protein